MSTMIRTAIVAVALLSGISAASARSAVVYDSATPRTAYDLNTQEGAKAFWENLQRSGN